MDKSVLTDLYQEYKYDIGYGAVDSSMTFDEWLEAYGPQGGPQCFN